MARVKKNLKNQLEVAKKQMLKITKIKFLKLKI